MPQPRWLFLGAVMAIAAVALLVATFGRGSSTGSTDASPSPSAPIPDATAATGTSKPSAPTSTTASTSATTPTPRASAPSSVPVTAPPRASGPPLLAWAEFLSRLNEDRSTVDGLNRALTTAAEAQDADAVRVAAVDILDFVDVERDWLREHPPADCYAAAHAAATAMLDAYGTAADRFIDWTTSGGGLGGLPALGVAVDAADTARAAFTTFVTAMEGTTCPT